MNKSIAITGAASGVGYACAATLLDQGWRVFAMDMDQDGLQALRDTAGESAARLVARKCDMTDARDVQAAFAEIQSHTGTLDALLCSAGTIRTGPVGEMSVEDYDLQFAVNTRGPWLCMKAALPALKRAASEEHPARAIMVSSISAIRPKVGSGVYAASKAALSQLTRVLAAECAADQVLVNAIAPSTINTPFIRNIGAGPGRQGGFKLSGTSPLGRVSEPQDIVDVIEFLLGRNARFITGVTLPVDGGTSAAFANTAK